MYYHFFLEKDFSPFISAYLIFNLLFFIIAPLTQISELDPEHPKYVNNLPYVYSQTIRTNLYILLFNITFFVSYIILKKRNRKEQSFTISKMLPFDILVVLVLCILILVFNIDYIQHKLVTPNWKLRYDEGKSIKIIISKVLFSLPLAGIAMCTMYFRKKKKKPTNWLVILVAMIIFLTLLLIFKNPFMEKRSGLGPVYFCLLFLFIPKLLNSNIKTTLALYASMILIMPLLAIFTHVNASFSEVLEKPSLITKALNSETLLSNFNTLHFDAYANFLATQEYASIDGFSKGEQLGSAFFFFVPRSIWESKPITTGQLVGNHLIEKHDFWFNNLSNPYISEAYLNFGIVGIILFAFVFAYVLSKAVNYLRSDDYLKKTLAFFTAIHLVYFLRGDFTNGFSQLVLVAFGIYVIPKMVPYIYKRIRVK